MSELYLANDVNQPPTLLLCNAFSGASAEIEYELVCVPMTLAQAKHGYAIDASKNVVTLMLPPTATDGDRVSVRIDNIDLQASIDPAPYTIIGVDGGALILTNALLGKVILFEFSEDSNAWTTVVYE